MDIMMTAKELGAVRFNCAEDDIKVCVTDGDVVEISHKPSGAAVYYSIDDFADWEDDE